jgi:UPF0755 protein
MKKWLALLIIAVFLISSVLLWWANGISAVDKNNTTKQSFVIPPGAGIKQIASDLKSQKLIKNPIVFYFLVKQLGIEKKIQAGSYQIAPSQTAEQIATSLTQGTTDIWVTIPEGKRASEVADIMSSKIPGFDESWREILQENEGYLFPDTYLFPKDSTIDLVVSTMRGTFDKRFQDISKQTDLTDEQIVILASMLEREAKTDAEKPMIAGIIHNRLDEGMALQIDATIQYAKGHAGAWWKPVTLAEYKSVNSPYNTYLFAGLPPGPISNPGLESLKAAAAPADNDYLFYLHDQTGNIRYAKTLEQHEANITRYGL